MNDSVWEKENIPDEHLVYMRVHSTFIRDGIILPACFKDMPNDGDGMSTNWCRYTTPEKTCCSGRGDPKNYAVIALNVGEVRSIPMQSVDHDPLPENRAHALALGPKDVESRVRYRRISRTIIQLGGVTAQDRQ